MYAFSEEQLQLRDAVRRFLDDKSTTQQTRALLDSAESYESLTYKSLLTDLGVGGIHVPEIYGGAGLSYVELGIVLEEMGRNLYPSPFFSSNVLAINALLLAGSEEQKSEILPQLIGGELVGTVALYESSNQIDLHNISSGVSQSRFSGTKTFITNGSDAELVVLVTRSEDQEIGFYLVRVPNENVECREIESLDTTRPLSEMSFNDVSVELLLGSDGNTFTAFIDLALIALSNEMVGGSQALLDSAVEYAKSRVQFGRSIDSMQAIKHKCADLLLEVELAKSAAYRAAQAVTDSESTISEFASLAKVAANEAYMQAAKDTIQVHGGIGFTWENDTHLWYRRAKSSEVFLGTSSTHQERFLQCHVQANGGS